MPEENSQSASTEGTATAEDTTGSDIGLAPDFFENPDTETPDDATGAEDGLSQEGEQTDGKEDAGTPAVDETTADAEMGEPVTAPVTPPEVTPAEGFYKYGDQTFESPDAVGNYIKSVEGRQRHTQAAHNDAMQKNEAYVKWGNDPEQLRIRLAELEGIKPEEVKVTDEKKSFLNDTDWKTLSGLVDKGEGKQALATMAHMFDEVLETRLAQVEAKFQASVQPFQDQAAAREATVSLFVQAENAMDTQGNLVWPEFNRESDQYDPQFCQIFAKVWEQLPSNVAHDRQLHGVEVAYNRTKQFLASQETSETPATTPPAETVPGTATTPARDTATGRFVKQTEEMATAVGGSGAQPPPSRGPAESYAEAAIISGMDKADADRDPVLGIRK